jgi:hypothetical protein
MIYLFFFFFLEFGLFNIPDKSSQALILYLSLFFLEGSAFLPISRQSFN